MPPSPLQPSPVLRRPPALWAVTGLMACALGACSTPPPAPMPPPEPPRPAPTEVVQPPEPPRADSAEAPDAKPGKVEAADPVTTVLAQMDATLRLAPPDLAREIARLAEAEEAAVENPLLLASALVQTRQPVDTARALGLVQRVLGNKGPQAQPLHPLARVLEARLLQQRRLEEQLERQNQQLRDAQRRNDQLNERLEAVRAIERSLTTRPAPAPTPPTSANGGSNNAPRPSP
ncbi:MAG: hypothetical protein ACK4HJ_01530 [Acidovorax sp.]